MNKTTLIKYVNGFEWTHENTIDKGKVIDLLQLLDKNGENKGDIMLKGKAARINMPQDEYLPFAENIFKELKPEYIRDIDYAISNDGDYYLGMDRIKQASQEGIKFDKVNIRGNYALSANGTLYLGEDAIKSIPEDVVLKQININGSKNITEFNHKVEVFLKAAGSNLTTIGPNAEFGGSVDISGCKNITEFNNKISDTLYAQDSGLTTIGPDAEFGGSVMINNCNITEFNHSVPKMFVATGSSLTTIGPNAEFGGYVNIENCKNLTEFNHKATTFNAENSGLEKIGPNAEFGHDKHGKYIEVIISGTPLSEEIGMDVIETPEEKQAFMDAIKSMDSKQEHTPEQAPEPEEEEYSMKM